jgi:hypothetical protein
MPKTEIDYSNTIIYKITCKDPDIKDVYVGHTTNFVQRKHAHKQNCNNPKSSNYACKLYNTIREKGGWTNWHMEILNFFNCFDHFEARQKEQEYFISLNANLNTIQPMPKPKEKEEEEEEEEKKVPQSSGIFCCEKCNYTTSRKSQYDRHNATTKHLENIKQLQLVDEYICKSCNKSYIHHSSLWKHKKNCKGTLDTQTTDSKLIFELLKQNQDFKELLLEQHNKLIEMYKTNMSITNNTNQGTQTL